VLATAAAAIRSGWRHRRTSRRSALVADGERVMLGRAPSWPERRYSALAGSSSRGRASRRPSRARSSRLAHLGFEAPHRAGEPRAREEDVQDVRWFSRVEVAPAAAADSEGWGAPRAGEPLLLPPRLAIARRLLERWLSACERRH
jgi:NAD+ diphosphatase